MSLLSRTFVLSDRKCADPQVCPFKDHAQVELTAEAEAQRFQQTLAARGGGEVTSGTMHPHCCVNVIVRTISI